MKDDCPFALATAEALAKKPNAARRARVAAAIQADLTEYPGTHYVGEFGTEDDATQHARDLEYLTTHPGHTARCVAWILPYGLLRFHVCRIGDPAWVYSQAQELDRVK